jgi:hypothetical protein
VASSLYCKALQGPCPSWRGRWVNEWQVQPEFLEENLIIQFGNATPDGDGGSRATRSIATSLKSKMDAQKRERDREREREREE